MAAATVMEFPLPNGKALGDATKGDLRNAISVYRNQSSPLIIRQRWFGLIERKLPTERHRVKSVLNIAQVERLREKAEQMR